MTNHRLGLAISLICAVMLLTSTSVRAGSPADVLTPSGTNPAQQPGFPIVLDGAYVRFSSITLGDLDRNGINDIIVGASDGKVHAYRGDGTKLWTYDTGDMGIAGKVALGDIDQDGWNEVVVGAGSTFTPATHGGLYVLDHLGNLRCSVATDDFNRDGWRDGVFSSPALADLDENDGGKLEIVFGGWDARVRVINHDCSPVWKKYVRDTIWSSPAIGDIDRDGHPEIVIGVDSHDEPAFGTEDGGILHVYNADGSELPGFPIQIDEVIYSSPALGDINGDGWLEIVVGTGRCWSNPDCSPVGYVHPGVGQYINVWDHNGNYLPNWPKELNNTYAFASPALADLDSDGLPEVIVNTADGWVHALNSDASYVSGWPARPSTPASDGGVVHFATDASPIAADVDGNGGVEVLLPSNWEIVAWDKTGAQLTRESYVPPASVWHLGTAYTVNGSPAVGDIDGDGDLEVVVGGAYTSAGAPGAIYAWDFAGPANAKAPWSAFRRECFNQARSDFTAGLSVLPTGLAMAHEYGDSVNPTFELRIENQGEAEVLWRVTSGNPRVSATPGSGTVSASQVTVDVEIDVSGLGPGTYELGALTITGTAGWEPVNGSPATVPITIYVGNFLKVYLPVAAR